MFHVSVCGASDDERLVGEMLCKFLGQLAGQREDVLFAYLCEEAQLEDAWCLIVESVEVQVRFEHDVRVGRLQRHQGQTDMVVGGVKVEATRQFCDLQAALVCQQRLPDEE